MVGEVANQLVGGSKARGDYERQISAVRLDLGQLDLGQPDSPTGSLANPLFSKARVLPDEGMRGTLLYQYDLTILAILEKKADAGAASVLEQIGLLELESTGQAIGKARHERKAGFPDFGRFDLDGSVLSEKSVEAGKAETRHLHRRVERARPVDGNSEPPVLIIAIENQRGSADDDH